jgi:rhodanese-related sulfurtransferase
MTTSWLHVRSILGFLTLLLVLILLTPSATACVNLTPREANELITTTEELVILDLRVKGEYLREHIDRAISVRDANSSLCAGKPVLIYDNDGTGCGAYNETIKRNASQSLGCTRLYHLVGGLQAWKDAGLPTVKTPIPTPPLPSFSIPVASTPEPSPFATATPPNTSSPAVASPQAPDFGAWPVVVAVIVLAWCSRRMKRGREGRSWTGIPKVNGCYSKFDLKIMPIAKSNHVRA